MAYRHIGDLADVFRHLALGEILATMRPAEYWESHAGLVSYEEIPVIAPERLHGAHFLAANLRQIPLLAMSVYGRALAREQAAGAHLPRIPGSPALALQFLDDKVRRFLFCDSEAATLQTIRQRAGVLPSVECIPDDGVSVLRGAAMVLSENWTPTTLAVLAPPEDVTYSTDAGISPLKLWCELASRGIRSVLSYAYDDDAGRLAIHKHFKAELDKSRLLEHGVQRFEGQLKATPPADAPTQYGFGLLTMHLPGLALERIDGVLKALESLYQNAALPTDGTPGSGAWTYTRAWM